MTNAETLQQNNSRLNINNVDLTSILDTINNLPENVEIKLQEKTVIPTTSQQEVVADEEYTGLSKVTVEEITGDSIEINPSLEEQNFNGVYTDIKVEKITGDNIEINPSSENQNFNGIYTDVTVLGDSNLVADNIKQGVSIFGVEGSLKASTSSAKITDASRLFYNGARLDYMQELLSLCENINNMEYMFYNCSFNLRKLDISNLDTSNVTNMSYMVYQCGGLTELDLSNFNTSNVSRMDYMFSQCSGLTKLDLSNFNTSNVTRMDYMFSSCPKLTELDLSNFNTSNVTNMSVMFYNDLILTSLNLSSFDMSKVNSIGSMFYNCIELTNLYFGYNLGKGFTKQSNNYSSYKLDLSSCTKLTHESLMDVINNLYDLNLTYDVANGGTLYTQQLVLGSTNLAKLTSEEIQIATNKGWSVS